MHYLRDNETFKKLTQLLVDNREQFARSITGGNALKDSSDSTAMYVARNIGRIEGLDLFLRFEGEKE